MIVLLQKENSMNKNSDYIETLRNIEDQLTITDFDNKPVILANALTRRNSKFTLEEEQLLMCVLSQLNPYGKNPETIYLNKIDLFKKLGLESTTRYRELKERFRNMTGKMWVDIRDEHKNERFGWIITGVKSDFKSEYFEVKLNDMFMPYIQELVNHYTKLSLESIVQFDSKYSLDLYKYLSSWKDKDWDQYRYLSTKQLKDLFGLNKEAYVRANGKFDRYSFERKTVDVAIAEINKKTDMGVAYTKHKKGNRVQAYIFEYNDFEKLKDV